MVRKRSVAEAEPQPQPEPEPELQAEPETVSVEVPEGFRALVEEYFRALSRGGGSR